MNDLISRKALLAEIMKLIDETDENISIMPEVAAIIREAQVADAVPVVRCKDCVLSGNCSTEDMFRLVGGIENPFCCVGKRKEGAEDG